MIPPLKGRPSLDVHDFATVRQLYSEAQQWARHYEMLVVNVNVLLISASLIFLGLALGKDTVISEYSLWILGAALVMTVLGSLLTEILYRLYATCIHRLIRLENLLNCYDSERFNSIDGAGSLLRASMMRVKKPASVRFFLWMYPVLALTFTLFGVFVATRI